MGLLDDVANYAENTIRNTVNDYGLDSLNSVFDNIPYLNSLGLNVGTNIFSKDTSDIGDLEKYGGELSASNRYDIVFILPTMLRKEDPNINDILRVFSRQFPIPSTSANVTSQKILDRTVSGVNSIEFDTINSTFFDTKNLALHKLFNLWNAGKWNEKGVMQFYPEEYKTDVMVVNYDNQVYLLKGLHPTSVGDIVFNHDSVDELLTFDVTFNVDKVIPYGDSKVGLGSSIVGINTGMGVVDDIADFGLGLAQNYFNNQINQAVSNATRSLTSNIGF